MRLWDPTDVPGSTNSADATRALRVGPAEL